jgi:exopolysaccharide biosynthesis polyprenyl glycosylphosphotransferase
VNHSASTLVRAPSVHREQVRLRAVPALGPVVDASKPNWVRRYGRYLMVCDLVVASAAAVTAWAVRFAGGGPAYLVATLAFPILWVLSLTLCRSYEPRFLAEGTEEFRRVFESAVRLVALLALFTYVSERHVSRGYTGVAFLLTVVGSLAVRAVARARVLQLRRVGRASHRVLVLGAHRSALDVARGLDSCPARGYKVVGLLTDDVVTSTPGSVDIIGGLPDVHTAIRDFRVDTLVVAPTSTLEPEDLRRLSWELEGADVDLVVSPNLTDVAGPRIHLRPVAGLPLLHVEKPEFAGLRRVAKSAFDRLVSLLALLVLTPLCLVLAVLVRLDSPGPAFFRQQRVGRGGSTFTLWKFRSMYVDAEHELEALIEQNEYAGGPLFKMRADPRVTRVGRFLRRTSLDELPQLINVVRGQMSLVGPRPPLPSEVEQYGSHVRRRLLVRPGLTGVWQVSGRSDLSWEESVRLDLHYVENWTLWFDISILCRTVRAVTRARGAY